MPIPNNIKCNPLKLKIIEVNAFKQAKKRSGNNAWGAPSSL